MQVLGTLGSGVLILYIYIYIIVLQQLMQVAIRELSFEASPVQAVQPTLEMILIKLRQCQDVGSRGLKQN